MFDASVHCWHNPVFLPLSVLLTLAGATRSSLFPPSSPVAHHNHILLVVSSHGQV